MLGVDATVVGRRARDLQLVAGQRDQRGIAARDRYRHIQAKRIAVLRLLHRLPLEDQVHKRFRRTVHDRRLARIHLDEDVVDAAAVQRAQHMLDQMDLHRAGGQTGVAHQIADQADVRFHLRSSRQVDAFDDDTVIHGRGLERERDGLTAVQTMSADRDFARESALLHRV